MLFLKKQSISLEHTNHDLTYQEDVIQDYLLEKTITKEMLDMTHS